MGTGQWQVPWQSRKQFSEAVSFFACIDRQRGAELDPVRSLAKDIEKSFCRMEDDLDRLCGMTCPECTDNCCERAVIWYDFKDLLYLYFGPGFMPVCQIVKSRSGGRSQCPNLDVSGCRLPRSQRPFVCTWYFCPAQKRLSESRGLNDIVLKIKSLRIEMEEEFCRITGGPPAFAESGRLQ